MESLDTALLRWITWLALPFMIFRVVGWFVFPASIEIITRISLIVFFGPAIIFVGVSHILRAHRTNVLTMPYGMGSRLVKREDDPMLFAIYLGSYWLGTVIVSLSWIGLIFGVVQV